MVFPTLLNLSLNLTIQSSWSEPQSAPEPTEPPANPKILSSTKSYMYYVFSYSNRRVAGTALVWWTRGWFTFLMGWSRMVWNVMTLLRITRNLKLMNYLFLDFFFNLIFSDCGWPWATETVESETTGIRRSLHSIETSDWGEVRLCWCVLSIALYIWVLIFISHNQMTLHFQGGFR